jgi:hypothetical protein
MYRPIAVSFGKECAQDKQVCDCVCISDDVMNVSVQKLVRNTRLCIFICVQMPILNV